ncbi:hypothetical protein NMY22_g11028 [Coprinellus aureogranulatus]|nr:hypothetical protein NMY22_g11028 [Coprinellus aureogranulatus]
MKSNVECLHTSDMPAAPPTPLRPFDAPPHSDIRVSEDLLTGSRRSSSSRLRDPYPSLPRVNPGSSVEPLHETVEWNTGATPRSVGSDLTSKVPRRDRIGVDARHEDLAHMHHKALAHMHHKVLAQKLHETCSGSELRFEPRK